MWLLLATPALAWTPRTTAAGDPVRWQGFPVTWSRAPGTAPLPPRGDAAIVAGFDQWKGPDREVDFELGTPPDTVPEVSPDWNNHVWMVNPWPFEGDDSLALASVWYDPGGNIITFDVRLNGEVPWSTDGVSDAFDLQTAVTHEVGHVLGLEHSELEEAVMWPVLDLGETAGRELSADDEEAVRTLYPLEDEPVGCAVAPTGGGLSSALLTWLLARRRRSPDPKEDPCSRSC